MAIETEWFGIAEGAATDARGSLTLVGFSPDFILLAELPGAINLFLVLRAHDDEDPRPVLSDKTEVALDAQVYGPDGKVLAGIQQNSVIGPKRYPELAVTATILLGLRLTFQKYGEHKAVINLTAGNEHLTAERIFHVVDK